MEAAALVVLGAALGYLAAKYEAWLKRRESKRTLATAILSELRWLEGILHQIYDYGLTSHYDPLEHPMIETALSELLIFEPETAERISHFHNLLRDTRALMNRYRESPDRLAVHKAEYQRFTKAKAFYAASAISSLASALVREGGRMPPPIEEKPIAGNAIPPMPARTFESFGESEDLPRLDAEAD
jgi:hypothetical protein